MQLSTSKGPDFVNFNGRDTKIPNSLSLDTPVTIKQTRNFQKLAALASYGIMKAPSLPPPGLVLIFAVLGPMQQHFKHYCVTIKDSLLYSCCLPSVIGPLSLLADRVDRRMNQKADRRHEHHPQVVGHNRERNALGRHPYRPVLREQAVVLDIFVVAQQALLNRRVVQQRLYYVCRREPEQRRADKVVEHDLLGARRERDLTPE